MTGTALPKAKETKKKQNKNTSSGPGKRTLNQILGQYGQRHSSDSNLACILDITHRGAIHLIDKGPTTAHTQLNFKQPELKGQLKTLFACYSSDIEVECPVGCK